jgi:hypothetical protein
LDSVDGSAYNLSVIELYNNTSQLRVFILDIRYGFVNQLQGQVDIF